MLVRPDLRDCVVFVGIRKGNDFLPRATGFIVSVEGHGFQWPYLVTSEHVIARLLQSKADIYVRATMTGGQWVKPIGPLEIDYWRFHPDNSTNAADVAIFPLNTRELAIKPIDFSSDKSIVCTPEIISKYNIGPGDEVAIVGLFTNHYGKERTIPIVRIGHLAAMREEPVHTKYCGYIDAYLIEAMSIGGLSGSPVFVNVPTKSIIDGKLELGAQTWLLGLMHGHFDVKDLNVDVIKEEGLSAINSGIGVVVPVERISETLAHPDVARHRREAAERTPKRDDPCPCGSGRKYIECHGAEIRSVTRLTLEELGLTADEFKAMLEAKKHRRGGNTGTD